jgi:hypothetical protein
MSIVAENALTEELEKVRSDNLRLRSENSHLRAENWAIKRDADRLRTVIAELRNRGESTGQYAPAWEMTAGTCVGPKRRA